MLHIICHLGKCKLKQDATTYLLEWPKFAAQATTNADGNVAQQEHSLSLTGARRLQPLGKTDRGFLTKLNVSESEVAQPCPTLCESVDC